MKGIKLKPALILLGVAAIIGFAIHYFTGFNWLTAGLIFLVAVFINGLAMFSEDIEADGFDYQKGITDTNDVRRKQKQAKQIQGAVICLLVVLAILSYVFKWGVT